MTKTTTEPSIVRTKDGHLYKDGMTLYQECLGVVTERPTTGLISDCEFEYAHGVPPRSEYVPSLYARKAEAIRVAINYWLKQMHDASDKIIALNKELNA